MWCSACAEDAVMWCAAALAPGGTGRAGPYLGAQRWHGDGHSCHHHRRVDCREGIHIYINCFLPRKTTEAIELHPVGRVIEK